MTASSFAAQLDDALAGGPLTSCAEPESGSAQLIAAFDACLAIRSELTIHTGTLPDVDVLTTLRSWYAARSLDHQLELSDRPIGHAHRVMQVALVVGEYSRRVIVSAFTAVTA